MKPSTPPKVFGAALLLMVLFICFRGCHGLDPFEEAILFGDLPKMEKYLKANPSLAKKRIRDFDLPLSMAARSQHPKEAIDLLIKYGADINAKGWPFDLPPLLAASWGGQTEAVKALLAHKPDVNATDKDGRTALNYAMTANSKEIAELLLSNGATLTNRYSVLFETEGRQPNLTDFVLSKGADPNARDGNGDTPLMRAALFGDSNRVATLLRFHPDLTLFYNNGNEHFTPLGLAMAYGYPDIALMIGKAALQYHTNTVNFAAAFGPAETLRELLATNSNSVRETNELGFTPLHSAALMGRMDAAEVLLDAGADPGAADWIGFHPLEWAACAGCLPLVESLAAKTGSDHAPGNQLSLPSLVAIEGGHNDVLQFLLDHGTDPDASNPQVCHGRKALDIAAEQGNAGALRLLLDHKATLHGSESLRLAVFGTSAETAELLLNHGASFSDLGPFKEAIFHDWAYGAGDPQIADLLLARHADVNAKDQDGSTPLHWAVRQGQKQAVEWLLTHGADVNAKDAAGKTALDFLQGPHGGMRRTEVAALLKSKGASPDRSEAKYYNSRSILLLLVLCFLAYLVSPLNSMQRMEREGLLVVYPAIILAYWFLFQVGMLSLEPGVHYYLGPNGVYVWMTNSFICMLFGLAFSIAILRSSDPGRRSYGRLFLALYILFIIAGILLRPPAMSG